VAPAASERLSHLPSGLHMGLHHELDMELSLKQPACHTAEQLPGHAPKHYSKGDTRIDQKLETDEHLKQRDNVSEYGSEGARETFHTDDVVDLKFADDEPENRPDGMIVTNLDDDATQ